MFSLVSYQFETGIGRMPMHSVYLSAETPIVLEKLKRDGRAFDIEVEEFDRLTDARAKQQLLNQDKKWIK